MPSIQEPTPGATDPTCSEPVVRNLRPTDLERVVRLDAKHTGSRRETYYELKLEQNLQESGIKVSLAAEIDGNFAGFLLARVFYGEFGLSEKTAVLETVVVAPEYQKRGVGHALLRQLRMNLWALGVQSLQTEVRWDEQILLGFFHKEGFRPAERFCLDLAIGPVEDGGP